MSKRQNQEATLNDRVAQFQQENVAGFARVACERELNAAERCVPLAVPVFFPFSFAYVIVLVPIPEP